MLRLFAVVKKRYESWMLLLLACTRPIDTSAVLDSAPPDTDPPEPVTCPEAGEAVTAGSLDNTALNEVSGVVESRQNSDVLWVHNDSGDEPRLYAISTAGALKSTWLLTGASRGDWEDLAIGDDGSGGSLLYVGDIGDNGKSRETITVHRVPEPEVITSEKIQAVAFDSLTLTYPDSPLNAETLLLDPLTDDLYVVTKDYQGATGIFRKAAPHTGGESAQLEEVAWLDFSAEPLSGGATTGGSISADGRYIVIRTYGTRAYVWLRQHGMSIAEAFAGEPCPITLPGEQQGESIGFASQGGALWSISEGVEAPVYSIPLQ